MFDRASLSEQVEESFLEEISSGRLRPGQKIDVGHYQRAWRVSVTPLRDAFRALEAKGYVTIAPRRGVYVSSIDLERLRDIFELRIALECHAIELAAARAPDGVAAVIRASYERARASLAAGDATEASAVDRLVHEFAQEHCGVTAIRDLIAAHTDLIHWAQSVLISRRPGAFGEAMPEHIEIITAAERRDGETARRAMRTHLRNSLKRLEEKMEEPEMSR
jgi:DNA-binding GntR family transcriptional regulator